MTEASARPARPEGSTIRTIVALNFVSAPTTDALRESLSLHDRMRDRYPRRQELRATTVAVNPGAMATGMNAGELVGFVFDYSKPDGAVKQAMGCADKAVYIQRTDCPDSAKVQREVQEEYELVLPVLGGDVANIAVERLDRFVWDGARNDFRAANVLRRESGWLAPSIFDAEDMWHSSHGLFVFADRPHSHRLLHAVDVRTRPASEAVPKEPGATIVVDGTQKLQVVHGMRQPEEKAQTMAAADLLRSEGRGGLLSEYMTDMLARTEELLSKVVNDNLRS